METESLSHRIVAQDSKAVMEEKVCSIFRQYFTILIFLYTVYFFQNASEM